MQNPRRPKRLGALFFGLALISGLVLPLGPAAATPEDGQIEIEDNSQFDAEHGVRTGKGTRARPYVIEGWDLHNLVIHDTNRWVVIRNNIIGRLTLNWVGDRVKVVNNRIGDLRVNENVERTGAPTSGVISHNKFGSVGQLRHWDGVFSNNIVGSPADANQDLVFGDFNHVRIANFDGFNGAKYRANTFYGYVEIRLHGHHHSSSFSGHSHHHAREQHAGMGPSHMNRHHRVLFTGNRIFAEGPYALIYTDSNHAGNDRTATSETNEELNNPHTHRTLVTIANNKLNGSGIVVDIFNADDDKHLRTQTGNVTLKNNEITLREYRDMLNVWDMPPAGIEVHQAKNLHLRIAGNSIRGPRDDQSLKPADTVGNYVPAGINLWQIERGAVHLTNNTVTNREAGIYAREFKAVEWWISGLKTEGVAKDVDYDNSSSQPKQRP